MTTTESDQQVPARKTLFSTLDGIRGIAALLVVMRHTGRLFAPFAVEESYLAVDVFFVLSGVVIAQAYGQKLLSTMSVRHFVWIRLVRIMPLYLLGTAVSVIAAVGGLVDFGPPALLATYIGLGIFMLPNPGIGTIDVYPLNNPSWSLPLELVTNFAYAIFIRRIQTPVVVALMIVNAAGLAAVITLAKSHSLNIGFWARSFPFGFFRVGYSFFAGVLLFSLLPRFKRKPQAGTASTLMAWLVVAAIGTMLMADPSPAFKPVFDFLAVTLAFPLLVGCGMLCQPSGATAALFRFLGLISYAVYTLHAPLSGLAEGIVHRLSGRALADFAPLSGVAFLLLLVPLAAFADTAFDNPVRRWLLRLAAGEPRKRATP